MSCATPACARGGAARRKGRARERRGGAGAGAGARGEEHARAHRRRGHAQRAARSRRAARRRASGPATCRPHLPSKRSAGGTAWGAQASGRGGRNALRTRCLAALAGQLLPPWVSILRSTESQGTCAPAAAESRELRWDRRVGSRWLGEGRGWRHTVRCASHRRGACARAERRQLRVGMGAAQTAEAVGGRSWLGAGRPRLTDGCLVHAGRVGARLGHRRALDSPAERWEGRVC